MATFVRNFHTPYVAATNCQIACLWTYAELFRLAGYTYDSDDGDPAWASALNVLVSEPGGVNGFQVDPLEPLIITDPLARFTQAMVDDEASIYLHAANDVNKGAWQMAELLTTGKVRIDSAGRPPANWVPETGAPGRVTIPDGLFPLDGAWILFNAPAPSRLQVRLVKTVYNNCAIYVRPKGQPVVGVGDDINIAGAPTVQLTDAAGLFRAEMVGRNITITNAANAPNNGTFPITGYVSDTVIQYTNINAVAEGPVATFDWEIDGDATETVGQTTGHVYDYRYRMNMIADGPNVFIFHFGPATRKTEMWMLVGELEASEVEDETPGFLWGTPFSVTDLKGPWEYDAEMLDHLSTPGQLAGHPTYLKTGWNTNAVDQWNKKAQRRLVNGYAFGRSPWVVMADVATGGYVRGRLPLVVFTSTAFAPYQPLDGAGQWQYLDMGLAIPRNGPNDPFILSAAAEV